MATETECPEGYVLPREYAEVHINGLNTTGRRVIGMHMNLEGTINESAGMVNNYEGLAELVGFEIKEILNFGRQRSPTEDMMVEWSSRADLYPTIGNLWEHLKTLERFDVLSDAWKYIKRDCDRHIALKSKLTPQQPIQVNQVSPGKGNDTDDTDEMTGDDVDRGTPTFYDAFICYSPEGPDIEFVRKLIEELEVKNGLKLFVPWRDDLPGAAHNTVCAKLIEHRCRKMIIILSPRYLKSSSCDFQTKFAQSLSPGSRGKRLIPVLIESCAIPELLSYITLCNYTKVEVREWFWQRLIKSVMAGRDDKMFSNPQLSSQLSSVNLDTSMRVDEMAYGSYSTTYSSTSSGSYVSSGSSIASTDYTSSGGIPTYLEFQPASPQTQRKFNDYSKMSSSKSGKNSRPRQPSPENRGPEKSENNGAQYPYSYSAQLNRSGPSSQSSSNGSVSQLIPRGDPLPVAPPRSPRQMREARAEKVNTGGGAPPPLPPREESRKVYQRLHPGPDEKEYFL